METPQNVFAEVLLDSLTTSRVIKAAVAQRSADDVVFVISSLAFDRWLEANKLEGSSHRYQIFLSQVKLCKEKAFAAIAAQRSSATYASLTQ